MFILLYSRDGRTSRHPLTPGDTVVGRAPICDLQIDDPSISRRHVRFRVHGDHCVLTDLGGRNGTFVNGEQVTEAEVQPGDAVVLGRFPLRVDRAAPEPVVLSDNHSLLQPERLLVRGLHEPQATLAGLPRPVPADRLVILLDEIARHLTSWRSPADLADRIVTVAFNVLPIDRAFLLLIEGQSGELQPKVLRTREGRPNRVTLNRTIVRRSLQDASALLGMDVAFDSHQGADTGHHPAPRSFICGPLPGSPGMLGVLYVDHPEGSALTSDDLEVFLALTRHASALLNHATATWRSFAETRLRDRLLLHHPPTVVAQLLESAANTESGREAQIHEVTLLAASVTVRGRRPAAEALQAVTHAFTLLCDAAFAEDGSLIRFDGDIALFVFGAPVTAGDHADRALRAAEAMWQTLGALAPGPDVTIRIAIDTGPAITATIDSAGRHEHVVLGDVLRTVLSASGARAEPGLILLTSRTRSRLSSPPALQSVGTAGSIPVELFGHRISVGTRDE